MYWNLSEEEKAATHPRIHASPSQSHFTRLGREAAFPLTERGPPRLQQLYKTKDCRLAVGWNSEKEFLLTWVTAPTTQLPCPGPLPVRPGV